MSRNNKIFVNMTLDPDVVAQLDEWRRNQKFQPPRNQVIETLIRDFLAEQAKNRKDKP